MLVVVGGHSRKIGKTSVAEGIIRRLPARNWTAVKITQSGHGICGHDGRRGEWRPSPGRPYALSEEREPGEGDSARFLRAGARRAFWLRTEAGQLAAALPALRRILADSENALLESNSVMEYLRPDVYLMVLDFGSEDFKPSALRFMDRAGAFVIVDRGFNVPMWREVSRGLWDGKPHFPARPPDYVSEALADFVASAGSGAV
ncbi:MAG: hypothetical protein ACE15B_14920 [Bryobacteraceae bacterium]